MQRFRKSLCLFAAALTLVGGFGTGARAEADIAAIARDMYIFTFPLHEFYRVRYIRAINPTNPQRVPLNQFRHTRDLLNHTDRVVTSTRAHSSIYRAVH